MCILVQDLIVYTVTIFVSSAFGEGVLGEEVRSVRG